MNLRLSAVLHGTQGMFVIVLFMKVVAVHQVHGRQRHCPCLFIKPPKHLTKDGNDVGLRAGAIKSITSGTCSDLGQHYSHLHVFQAEHQSIGD